MTKPNEDDFVNEGLSEDELNALNTDPEPEEVPAEDLAAGDDAGEEGDGEPVAKDAAPKEEEQPKSVDIRALQEARAENREMRERYNRLEERTNQMLQMLTQRNQPHQEAKPKEPEIPDEMEDPQGAITWLKTQLLERQRREAEEQQRTQQMTAQEQAFQQAFYEADGDFRRAAAEDPEVEDAYAHALESYKTELETLGYSEAQKQQQLNQFLQGFVFNYMQQQRPRGVAINDYVKSIAKARGWSPTAGKQTASETEKLKKLAGMQEQHMSLSDAPGGEAPKGMTAKDLAQMSDAQFQKLMADPTKSAEIDKIMGIAS